LEFEGAAKFLSEPPAGTLTKTRPNGDKLFYDPASNTFGLQAVNGAPRTMFRPTDGINYWNKQWALPGLVWENPLVNVDYAA